MKCYTCKRELNNEDDPLSIDCGNDCIHCQLNFEQQIGDYKSIISLAVKIMNKTAEIIDRKIYNANN